MDKLIKTLIIVIIFNIVLFASEKRGWLGVYAHELSGAVKIALDIDYGVIVDDVVEGSPAEKAGIKKGDVILKIDAEEITDMDDLHYIVKKNPGKEVKIEILRKGKKRSLSVRLGEKEGKFYGEYRMEMEIPGCGKFKIPEFKFWMPERFEDIIEIIPHNEEKIEKLEQQIEEIKKKLKELEKKVR